MTGAGETAEHPRDPASAIVAGGALLLFALVAYYPALSGGFVWDDDSYVTNNTTLRSMEGLWRIWTEPTASPQYYPLVFTTFWVEYQLWELAPLGYHLTNVLLHWLNGVLLWRLLRQLELPAAWLAAAVFVLHPVQVESVAWITERKNVLSSFFYFAAALAYFRFSPPGARLVEPPERWNWYALSLGLFTCALLAKTVACSLPAALLLLLWWKRERISHSDLLHLVPFFTLGVLLAVVTVWMEKHHVGAAGPEWELSPIERVLIAGRALVFYAGKLCWPTNLTFIYPRWLIDAGAAWQYLFPLAVLAVLAAAWVGRRTWGRGPLAACLFFAGTLVPALGFIDVYPMRYSFVADHFQYLASVGLIVLVVAAGRAVLHRLGPAGRVAAAVAGAAVLIVLGVLTWRQAGIYKDLPTLWRDTIEKNPGSWMAHTNLGVYLFREGEYDGARAHYAEAVRLKPDDPSIHYYLGEVLALQGRPGQAIIHFSEALRLRPNYPEARALLGVALAQHGKPAEALPHLLEAVGSDPNNPQPIYNLAVAYSQLGRMDEAIRWTRYSEARWPWDPQIQLLSAYIRMQVQMKKP
jgi:tetratricopeptide (TPR) repeat protein